jgi:hypothetical protein
MGFHLWIDRDIAWAQGTYEYRPMGTATVSTSDLFRRRDFRNRLRPPLAAQYLGQFASIGQINAELIKRRRTGRRRR